MKGMLFFAFVLVLACPSARVVAQSPRKARGPSHADIRAFAQAELDGKLVKYATPKISIINGKLLSFSLGRVDAVANTPLEMQLYVELLRKHPILGERLTAMAIRDLEKDVIAAMGDDDPVERELHDAVVPYVMEYAASKRLFVAPRYAFGADKFYIGFELVDSKKATFENVQKEVQRCFDNEVVGYRPPTTIVGYSALENRSVTYFDSGEIEEGVGSHSAIGHLFQWELMIRKPNVDKKILDRHRKAILDRIRKQFEREQRDELVSLSQDGDDLDPSFAELMRPVYEEHARAKGFGFRVIDTQQEAKTAVEAIHVIIKAEKTVSKVLIVPALLFRFAEKTKSGIPMRNLEYVGVDDDREFRAGTYMYQLIYRNGTRGEFAAFSLPDSLAKNRELRLR